MIYITGHQRPDTDSIVSAIALAALKNSTGKKALACRLGQMNKESIYLLERFGFEVPMLLQDVRMSLEEIALDEAHTISDDAAVFEALKYMEEKGRNTLSVTDAQGRLCGILSYRDIARLGLRDTAIGIEYLSGASLQAMAQAVEGTIVQEGNRTFNGKVSIVAYSQEGVRNYEVHSRLVIVGNDEEAQLELIRKGAAILVIVWSREVSSRVLEEAARQGVSIIISGHGGMNTIRYIYFAVGVKSLMHTDVMRFRQDQKVEDVAEALKRSRHRAFPVVDGQGKPVGFLERYHIFQAQKRQMILVDHNEFGQSAPGIESAAVLEVIDHHRVAGFYSMVPVYMRCEIVGATSTIITKMFRERSVQIPPRLAGLLLGAILSDTLKFSSPTTTQEDIFTAHSLAQIAGLNLDTFAREMFSVSTNLEGMSAQEILSQDVKNFEIDDKPFEISQTIVYHLDDMAHLAKDLKEELEARALRSGKTQLAAITSISQKATRFLSAGSMADQVEQIFVPDQIYENLLSRKNQILPALISGLQQLH